MKYLFFSVLLLAAFTTSAQKIDRVETDKFTGKKKIQTDKIVFFSKFDKDFNVSLFSDDTTYFFRASGMWAAGPVSTSDKMIFLLENKDTVVIYPATAQPTNNGGKDKRYSHMYLIKMAQLKKLAAQKVTSLRRTYSGISYEDADIKDKKADKLKELADAFVKEIEKK